MYESTQGSRGHGYKKHQDEQDRDYYPEHVRLLVGYGYLGIRPALDPSKQTRPVLEQFANQSQLKRIEPPLTQRAGTIRA